MDGLIGQSRLLEITGLRQKAALRRHLKLAGIPFREVAGTIVTTEAAITATLTGRAKKKKEPSEPNWSTVDE